MLAPDPIYHCSTCHHRLRPLKTDPSLGLLCYHCPAIVTVFPDGECHVREAWSGREFTTTLEALRQHPAARPSELRA